MKLVLCGNPNSGKTTLLNRLAGARLRTGNFPGVTVERAEAPLLADPSVTLIDLPGVYALDAPQGEEALARAALFSEKPDAILNVLDATSLSRGLCLTLELLETGTPVLVALTMLDELPKKGAEVDFSALSRELGAPVFPADDCETALLAALERLGLRRETPHAASQTEPRLKAHTPETGRDGGSASGAAQEFPAALRKNGQTVAHRGFTGSGHSADEREFLGKHKERRQGDSLRNPFARSHSGASSFADITVQSDTTAPCVSHQTKPLPEFRTPETGRRDNSVSGMAQKSHTAPRENGHSGAQRGFTGSGRNADEREFLGKHKERRQGDSLRNPFARSHSGAFSVANSAHDAAAAPCPANQTKPLPKSNPSGTRRRGNFVATPAQNGNAINRRDFIKKHTENKHTLSSCTAWTNTPDGQPPAASRSASSFSANSTARAAHPHSAAASRFARADEIVARAFHGTNETAARARSRRADRILMHPLLAAPIFLAVMAAMLYLTFGPVGGTLGSLLGGGVERAFAALDRLLTRASAPEWIRGLLCEGVLNGLGAVLGFLPTVLTLFFLLSLIEDSGYMARMACCADRLFRRLGLNGRAFVPALLGFGCTVPAILATRTLPDARDRRRMTLLLPFCSCSAKLPVYSLFAAAFFPGRETLVIGALYALGALLMLPAAFCMNRLSPGEASAFVLELPSYRMPSARAAFSLMRTRSRVFVRCALTTLLPASVAVWLLNAVKLGGQSLLEALAGAIAPVFLPAGFGSWQAAAALLTGLSAKEAVLSTFGVLLHAPGAFALRTALRQLFTPLSAASFLTFTLLYTPCAAAFGAARRELGSVRTALCAAILQCGAAYLAACAVFNFGRLFGLQ